MHKTIFDISMTSACWAVVVIESKILLDCLLYPLFQQASQINKDIAKELEEVNLNKTSLTMLELN